MTNQTIKRTIYKPKATSAGASAKRSGCPLVLIEWEDSRQPIAGWAYVRDFAPVDNCRCTSVGWLVYDGLDKKVLAPNMGDIGDEHNVQLSGVIHIPARCVIRVKRITESD